MERDRQRGKRRASGSQDILHNNTLLYLLFGLRDGLRDMAGEGGMQSEERIK